MSAQGFTLIELLLAMAMGSLLLLTLTQVVQASKAAYRVQEALVHLQSSGRLVMDLLARDIRMSGFSGCASSHPNSIDSELQTAGATLMSNFAGFRLEGMDDYNGSVARYAQSRPFANRTARSRPVPGTDVLILRLPVGEPLRLAAASNHQAGQLWAWPAAGAPVEAGDLLLLSDCNHARVFRATGSGFRNNGGLAVIDYPGDWAAKEPIFHKGAEIYRLETRMYYVRRGVRGDGNSLYLQQGGENSLPQELVEGVEDLQILYGIGARRGNGLAVQRYLSASAVESGQLWDQVVSVRLRLRLASLQGQLSAVNRSADGHLQRDFVSLVTLRNRSL